MKDGSTVENISVKKNESEYSMDGNINTIVSHYMKILMKF